MNNKKTIGSNPLEAYLSDKKEQEDDQQTDAQTATSNSDATAPRKERITIHLPVDLISRVKDAVYWEPGVTLTGFAEHALERALAEQVEKRGEPYPERKEKTLKSGRPVV